MALTFWRKNGKLICDDNRKLIKCSHCPCDLTPKNNIKITVVGSLFEPVTHEIKLDKNNDSEYVCAYGSKELNWTLTGTFPKTKWNNDGVANSLRLNGKLTGTLNATDDEMSKVAPKAGCPTGNIAKSYPVDYDIIADLFTKKNNDTWGFYGIPLNFLQYINLHGGIEKRAKQYGYYVLPNENYNLIWQEQRMYSAPAGSTYPKFKVAGKKDVSYLEFNEVSYDLRLSGVGEREGERELWANNTCGTTNPNFYELVFETNTQMPTNADNFPKGIKEWKLRSKGTEYCGLFKNEGWNRGYYNGGSLKGTILISGKIICEEI